MTNENSQNNTGGQGGMDSETEQRNRENETGQQSPPQNSDPSQSDQSQSGQSQGSQSQSEGGQSGSGQEQLGQAQAGQSGGEGGSGFVGSSDDQSSDYLTKGENQDFETDGQGASDTDAGTSDIETGQAQSPDATLDDGSDTSQ